MRSQILLATLCLSMAIPPATVAASWRSEGPPAGTVYDVAIDPSKPSTVYALTWNGGLWRSDDGGASWTLPSTELVGRTMLWLEIDRANPATLWAGEKDPGEPALWRSKDRGATWKLVRDKTTPTGMQMHPVGYRIAFAPTRPADIWVPSTNLHYRSRDGGKTWTDFRVPDQDSYAIAVDPKNPDVIYSGGHGGDKTPFSRSDDGGKSWKAVGSGVEGGVQALVHDGGSTLYAVGSSDRIWKSTDRGDSWTEIASPVTGTDDVFRLQVDPSNPSVLFAATGSGLKKSVDGGASWRSSDESTGRFLVRSVAFDPKNASRMFAAVSGTGIFRSDDQGGSWTPSNGGFSASWIEGLEGSPRNATLYARASIGLYRRDVSGDWSEVQSPFAEGKAASPALAFDRQAPRGLWAFSGAQLWRSPNDGLRWDAMKIPEVKMRDMMKGRTSVAEFGSFVQDPGNPQILYGGAWSSNEPGLAVSKSVDGGKSWKPSGKGLPGEEVDLMLAEAPGVVFALVDDDDLYRSDDGGGSWKGLPAFPKERRRKLLVDPSLPSRLYFASEKGLFRSTDSGESWTKLEGTIGKEDVEDIVVSPSGDLYAGHFHGVTKSVDGGVTWTSLSAGLPNTDVRALAIFGSSPSRLAVGTAGNGVYSLELP